MKRIKLGILSGVLVLVGSFTVQAQDWTPITGTDTLKDFMVGLKAERTLPDGEVSRAEYFADGTGVVSSWGASIPRTWEVKEDNQLCFTLRLRTSCFTLDQNVDNPNLYRINNVKSGGAYEFTVSGDAGTATDDAEPTGSKGGAAVPSADEIAAELANPNTPVATLTFKNQIRWFEGDLEDADDQSSYTLLFQPSLPFVLPNKDTAFWRPAIPVLVDQPMLNKDGGGFSGETGLGDIAFDLAYAPTLENKSILTAYGLVTSLPTATNDLGSGQWTLGPEFLIGKLNPTWVIGALTSHQWVVTGWTNANINLTTSQLFYTYLPGGGWNVGTSPIISYDWESEQWTVPLQLIVGKTVVWNGRPWKLSVEVNYYVEKSDNFGPEWMVGFNIAPVVKNGLVSLFGLGD